MVNAVICHHYGWTDIINTLSITNFLLSTYTTVFLIYHKPKEALYNYYYRNCPSIQLVPFDTPQEDTTIIENLLKNSQAFQITGFHFFGFYDKYRQDRFQGAFQKIGSGDSSQDDTTLIRDKENQEYYFVRKFYETYQIPYIERVESFFLDRYPEKEEAFYKSMVKSSNYILIHDTPDVSIPSEIYKGKTYYQLNQSSNIFFDAVKVLENALEIHCIDSVWAAVCYLIDAKYNLLRNVRIFVYCLRGHQLMFKAPVALENWVIIDSSPRIIH